MSEPEEFEQTCPICSQPIRIKWENGAILPPGTCLVVDDVFHDECCDKFVEQHPP